MLSNGEVTMRDDALCYEDPPQVYSYFSFSVHMNCLTLLPTDNDGYVLFVNMGG